MTTEPTFDRQLRELMAELAAPGDTAPAIDNVLSVTRPMRPEPRWLVLLKERPMRTSSVLLAGSPSMQFGLDLRRHRADRPARRDRRRRRPRAASAGPATRLRAGRQRRPCLRRVRRHRDDRRRRDQRHRHHDRTGRSTAVPVFSRDGTRIAFLRKESDATKLVVANADGTGHGCGLAGAVSTTSTRSTGPRTAIV